MTKINISVAMTTYNAKKNLIEQLDSLRNQTQSIDEVIICDDCSIDGTQDMVKKYIELYKLKNWKFYQNFQNLGWKRNFMQCIWITNGDICFLCDQDDIWHLDKIEKMFNCMMEHEKIDVLTSKYTSFTEEGIRKEEPENINGGIHQQKMTDDFLKLFYPGCTYCIRRSFVEETKNYWRENVPHDAFFWRMSLIKGTLYKYGESLVDYRIHSDSTFAVENKNRRKREKRIEWAKYAEETLEYLEEYLKPDFAEYSKKKRMLFETRQWLSTRYIFLANRSVIKGIESVRFLSHYQSIKQYVGDWISIMQK